VLGFVGGLPVEDPYIMVGKFATILYFFYFLVILPGLYVLDIYYMQYFTVFKRKRG
jgi:ubiquinol-cytochrome c reductase cytochrome b subunit